MRARQYHAGITAFFLNGICAISAGVIVSILHDRYQFNYGFSGTLISVMSIGNMTALIASGILPGLIGERDTTLLLCSGYALGYLLMALTGSPAVLLIAFLLAGLAKGCGANICTNLVGNNTDDRPKAMILMNAWFALGALICPFLISLLQKQNELLPMIGISITGLFMWITFLYARIPGRTASGAKKNRTEYSFLRSAAFWIPTMLLFCQNAAEYTVNGWVVTYYKNEQILSGTFAAYTITVQWALTLIARLILAFGVKINRPYKAMTIMGVGLTLMYLLLLQMRTAIPALIALGLFSFSLAGIYPLAVASIGEMTSSASVGLMLAFGGIGGIIFPWIVGIVADVAGLRSGMAINLIPCAGIIFFPLLISSKKSA